MFNLNENNRIVISQHPADMRMGVNCLSGQVRMLGLDPSNGDVYVADAIDYQQQGQILRYSQDGELLDSFYVGIIPGAFCWKY